MKTFSTAICLVSVGILSGCVGDRGYSGDTPVVKSQSCGNGENDVSHPYAGRCDWRRENGRDWADSGGSVYRRGR